MKTLLLLLGSSSLLLAQISRRLPHFRGSARLDF